MLLWWWCGQVATGKTAGPIVYLPIWAIDTNAFVGLPGSQPK